MCFNCGCNMPNDNMGSDDNITEEAFKKAAAASTQSVEEAKKNTLDMLKKQLGE